MRKLMVLVCALFLMAAAGAAAQGDSQDDLERLRTGKKTFESVCGKCHALEVSLSKVLERAEWTALVEEMISGGAELDAQEKATVVDYLTVKSAFETKCTTCHGKKKTTTKRKIRESWLQTVKRMSAKKPGLFTRSEISRIAGYLYLVLGAD